MKKSLNKVYMFFVFNTIFTILLLMINISSFKAYIWIPIILFTIYIFLLDIYDLIINQIILLIDFNVIYDILWRKTNLDIPLNCRFIIDIISVIILLKIIINFKQFKNVIKDSIFWIVIIFIIFSIVISAVNKISLINYLMSLNIYIRFMPTYIVLSISKIKYKSKYLYLFIIMNLFLIVVQSLISYYDDVAGVFGIRNVHILLLFLIIITAIITTIYCKNKMKLLNYLISIIIIFLICALGEIKIGMVIIPIEIIFILLFNTINPIKFFVSIISCIVMINIGLDILVKVSPDFLYFFNKDTIKQNIIDYTMKPNNSDYSLGRLENIIYSNDSILTNTSSKITGLGVGSSMPPETYYHQLDKNNKGRVVNEIYKTQLYNEYGPYLGYHLSTMNILFLETGLIGLFIYFIIIIIFIIRSLKLIIKIDNIFYICIGNAALALLCSLIGLMFYYNYILDRGAMLLITIMMAIITKNSKKYLN